MFASNYEGVDGLRKLASSIVNDTEAITEATKQVEGVVSMYEDTLGPHSSELHDVIEDIRRRLADMIGPAHDLADQINGVASGYEASINNNRFAF